MTARSPLQRLAAVSVMLSVVVASVALLSTKSQADTKLVQDADDTAGALDVSEVGHSHGQNRLLIHRLSTYESWSNDVLLDEGTAFWFEFFPAGGNEKYVRVDVSPDGNLYGEVIRWDGETILAYVKVWRPDDRTIQIEFPKRILKLGLHRYSWNVASTFRQPGASECGGDPYVCSDHVPDQGAGHTLMRNIVHRLE